MWEAKGITEDKRKEIRPHRLEFTALIWHSAFWKTREVRCLITGLSREISGG